MTSCPIIQTRSQSRVLKECRDTLNAPSTSAPRDKLTDEGEFLSFSNHHTPVGTALPDPSTPTPALRNPYEPGLHSAVPRFSNTMYIPDYARASWSGGGGGSDSNPPSPNPPNIPLPDSPAPSNPTPIQDPLLLFVQAVQALTRVAMTTADHDTSSSHTKVCEPDTFDRTDSRKLHTYLVQCELNFQDHPKAFTSDRAKVTFTQSYLKGIALEWFKPDLLNSGNPQARPIWMDNYQQFVQELQSNFGLHNPVGDAEHQLDNLSMKDRQKINKYVVEFNHLAGQVHGWGDGTLHHVFYSGLPDHIKDEISRVSKPRTLDGYRTLAQTIDARYWEHKSKISQQTKNSTTSSSSASKGSSSGTSDSKSRPKEKGKSSDNKSTKPSSNASSSKPSTSETPSHLSKGGKLTNAKHQCRIKEKLCMFCGQSGHMAKDCPKSTSKSAKACAAKVKTPAAAESKK